MKRGFKKYVSLLLALLVVMSVFAGCGSNTTANTSTSTVAATSGSSTTSEDAKPAEPAKLSVLTFAQPDVEYNEKVPVLEELAKRVNIKIEWQNLPIGGEAEKLDLIFASGNLPDISIFPDQTKIAKMAKDGAIVPLEGLIEQYGPNIKAAFTKQEQVVEGFKQKLYSLDGHIYNIPSFEVAGSNAGMTWAIREDWCKNVGLAVPTTTDELYAVLKAFKEKDPNGNGEKDELPMVSRNDKFYLLHLVNSFGTQTGLYWNEKDQQVKYGQVTPEFKEALEFVHKLYAEKLIDPEFITNTDDQFIAKVTDNKAGMFLGYANSQIGYARDELKKDDPKFNLVPMLPVAGPRGDCFKQDAYNLMMYRASVTSACKNPEVAMKLLDYCFSAEGHELLSWGLEGKTFVRVGDKKEILDYVTRNPDGLDPMNVSSTFGINAPLPHVVDQDAYFALSTPFVASIFKLYGSKPGVLKESLQVTLTGDESEQTKKHVDSFKYMSPMVVGFITGKEPLTKWDEYVAQATKLGILEFCKVYTEAYKRQYGIK